MPLKKSIKDSNIAFVQSCIESYEGKVIDSSISTQRANEKYIQETSLTNESIINATESASNTRAKYFSFVESVKASLLLECMHKILEASFDEDCMTDTMYNTVGRVLCSNYIHETGTHEILSKMRTGSVMLSEMYNIIEETSKHILEGVDKNDSTTFVITTDDKSDFFKKLDHTDYTSVSDAIKDRVTDAMSKFIKENKKNHEDTVNALELTKERIDQVETDNGNPEDAKEQKKIEEVQEAYTALGKQYVWKINSREKTVLNSMVNTFCETVIKDPRYHADFMNEGILNMDKIVRRSKIMYTFFECLNTCRFANVDEAFIESAIESLK